MSHKFWDSLLKQFNSKGNNRPRCLCIILLTTNFPLSDQQILVCLVSSLTNWRYFLFLLIWQDSTFSQCYPLRLSTLSPSENGGGPRSLYVLLQSEMFGQTSARHFLWPYILSSGVWGCISLLQSWWAPPHLPAGEGPLPKQWLWVPRHSCAQPNVCTPWSVPGWTLVLHYGVEQMAN